MRFLRLDAPVSSNIVSLLIGINYEGKSHKLNGCINDVLAMNKYLMEKNQADTKIMMDRSVGDHYPTKANILKQLTRLVELSWSGSKYFLIYYSGHGSRMQDRNGDENDNYDECLVSVDDKYISDDEMKELFSKFAPGTKVFMIADCCHSGSILDLPIRYENRNTIQVENNNNINAEVIKLTGCRDDQYSADTWNRDENKAGGALSIEFMKCIRKDTTTPIIDMLENIKLELVKNGYGSQTPQLSTSFLVDKINLSTFIGL